MILYRHKKAHGVKPRRNSRHRWVDYYYLISVGKSTKNNWNRQKKARNFRRICREYVLEHKIGVIWGGEGMKRNKKEWFSGINRNQSENDREWPEKRANYERITTENDRKRPQDLPSVLPLRGMDSSEIPRFSVHFPRKFPDFPRNSLIFPDFLRYSPNFS